LFGLPFTFCRAGQRGAARGFEGTGGSPARK